MVTTASIDGDDTAGFHTSARPVLQFVAEIEDGLITDQGQILGRAEALLVTFEDRLRKGNVVASSIPPARYALAALIDDVARQTPDLNIGAWSAASHRVLFGGRDMSWETVRGFAKTARDSGRDFAPVAEFLDAILHRVDHKRRSGRKRKKSSWGLFAVLSATGFATAIACYAAFLEYSYQSEIYGAFQLETKGIYLGNDAPGSQLVDGLDRLRTAAKRAENANSEGPVSRYVDLPFLGKSTQIQASYTNAVTANIPPALAAAIAEELATQGDSLKLYDTLRAWAILEGQSDWSDVYLAGWFNDRQDNLQMPGLATHLTGMRLDPAASLPKPDPEILEQARAFARETTEPTRAWLELRRSQGVSDLAGWVVVDAVPGLGDVALRRSGVALSTPTPGLFTPDGWAYARDFGAGLAVQRSRQVAQNLFAQPTGQQNNSADLVMDRLQLETVAFWKAWLVDLRVRPFEDAENSILISGRLAAADTPLSRLLQEVWAQAGGTDRGRRHENQLKIAAGLGPMIQYVEQGKMNDISALFAGLNVALGSIDVDEERGVERLMSVQERANSITALRQAPDIVVQIVEDVLAQTAVTHSSLLSNPLTRRWQSNIYAKCRAAFDGRYPFANGADIDIASFTELMAPGGLIDSFSIVQAQRYLDVDTTPWRWKPEARLSGLTPESAAFFQKSRAISQAFFGDDGRLKGQIQLTALAERGQAVMTLGGRGAPIRASGAPATLRWPGPAADAGVEVSFKSNNAEARLSETGIWGLFRLLDGLRLRRRDDGKRFLVDMRSPQGRLFVEMQFEHAANPVSARHLLKGFACPPSL